MKKILSVILLIFLLISLCSCGNESAEQSPSASPESSIFARNIENTYKVVVSTNGMVRFIMPKKPEFEGAENGIAYVCSFGDVTNFGFTELLLDTPEARAQSDTFNAEYYAGFEDSEGFSYTEEDFFQEKRHAYNFTRMVDDEKYICRETYFDIGNLRYYTNSIYPESQKDTFEIIAEVLVASMSVSRNVEEMTQPMSAETDSAIELFASGRASVVMPHKPELIEETATRVFKSETEFFIMSDAPAAGLSAPTVADIEDAMLGQLSDLKVKAIEISGRDGAFICDGWEYSGTRVHNGAVWWYSYRGCFIDEVFYSFGYGSADRAGTMKAPSKDRVFIDFIDSFELI